MPGLPSGLRERMGREPGVAGMSVQTKDGETPEEIERSGRYYCNACVPISLYPKLD